VSIFVCGSLHLDVIVNAPHLPRVDETVVGDRVAYAFGGKGGNQAVAAARMGAATAMAGSVGDDAFGAQLLAGLDAAAVDRAQVRLDPGASGMSVAVVGPDGGYGAIIVSGANLHIDASSVHVPDGTRVVLLQNEIPEAVNLAVARLARSEGAEVILNAAPARMVAPALLALIDVLVVNRIEAADLLGLSETALDLTQAAKDLSAFGPRSCLITLGADGLMLAEHGRVAALPAHPVEVVSTHGAGDAFLGALAAERARGTDFAEAVRFGQAAAALHVSTRIKARAMLDADQVRAFLRLSTLR